MTDNPQPYKESDDHVPNPLYQTGVVDTTGTTGDLGSRIDTISPIFQQARADAFGGAVEALDDPDINEDEKIVFHDEDETPSREEQEQRIRDAAEEAKAAADSGLNPAQAEAAKTGDGGGEGRDGQPYWQGSAEAPSGGGKSDGKSKDEGTSFSSKREAKEYADKHNLDVDESLSADEYKAAVAKAAKKSS